MEAVNNNGSTALASPLTAAARQWWSYFLRKGALVSMLGSEHEAARKSAIQLHGPSLSRHSRAHLAREHDRAAPPEQGGRGARGGANHSRHAERWPTSAARSKMIARLLTHLGRSFPGIHTPLLHYLDPLTRRSLIEAVAARRNDTHGLCKKPRTLHSSALQHQSGRRDAAHGIDVSGTRGERT